MKKIAILASDNMLANETTQGVDNFERDEQMGKIIPAFAAQNMEVDLIRWREAATLAHNYDAMLPLFVWDYFEGNETAFLNEIAKAEQKSKVFNPFTVLKWNSKKSYLDDLAKQGAPVIPTIILERVTESDVNKAFETLGTNKVVIKPLIGGGAWRQALYTKGEPFPHKDLLPPEGAMVQPFLSSVLEEGEYSFLYFGGHFSHGLIKRPNKGDYRIQSIYGGSEETYSPKVDERAAAREILDALDYTPLYARVDLIRGMDGQLKLIELEMIEPYLYLPHSKGEGGHNSGANALAIALKKRLEG